MFFIHRVVNAVTMMYNEADELTACHFIRPSTYWKQQQQEIPEDDEEPINSGSVSGDDNEKKTEATQPV